MDFSNLPTFLANNELGDKEIIDYLEYRINERVYYYGKNYQMPYEKYKKPNKKIIKTVKDFAWRKLLNYRYTLSKNQKILKNNAVISDTLFNIDKELINMGYNVYLPFYEFSLDRFTLVNPYLYKEVNIINKNLDTYTLNQLLNPDFLQRIGDFKQKVKKFYIEKNVKALISNCDTLFFQRLTIDIFKEINRPSFIYAHGLLGTNFGLKAYNRSDYLILWGEQNKKAYIEMGFDREKLIIGGHPYYTTLPKGPLRFSLENILVATTTFPGVRFLNDYHLSDRGNLILYVKLIEQVLKKLGVKKARLRPHPSENGNWYFDYIDNNFWILDQDNLNESLKKATLVIGSTSSVFIESLFNNVNYIIFNPYKDERNILNFISAPPFNGTDKRIPVAWNQDELLDIIENKIKVDISCVSDYIKVPFDLSFIKELI